MPRPTRSHDPDTLLRLAHSREYLHLALEGLTEAIVVADRKAFLLVYGPAVKVAEGLYMLTKEFKESVPGLDWWLLGEYRRRLVHEYFDITPNELWQIVDEDLLGVLEYLKPYFPPLER